MELDLHLLRERMLDALREDAADIKARGGERMQKDLFMLVQGAEHCLAKRLGVVSNTCVADDDPKYFKRGWEIASRMELNPQSAAS